MKVFPIVSVALASAVALAESATYSIKYGAPLDAAPAAAGALNGIPTGISGFPGSRVAPPNPQPYFGAVLGGGHKAAEEDEKRRKEAEKKKNKPKPKPKPTRKPAKKPAKKPNKG